ncbi:SRPBCC family protein [Kytococcus sp. Marseille-QA3725]
MPAAPQAVHALVSDVTRMGGWSPTCRACRWTDPSRRGVGATFEGDNETPSRRWTTASTVTVDEPGRFEWEVGGGFVRWGFLISRGAEGGTILTQTWHFTRAGRAFFDEKWGEDARAQADQRERQARADVPVTLFRIATTLQEDR